MKKAVIDTVSCDRSPFCPVKRVCPVKAVQMIDGFYHVDADLCIGCGKCVTICPMKAVSMT